jgi:GT2 family glycosyltransferase
MTAGNGAPGCPATVDVVIVNWNSGAFLRRCLAALDRCTAAERLRAIVVDNASSDRSADGLSAARMRLDVVFNRDNRGFAAACNQGAARGGAACLLFLNPDVEVEADAVANAARCLDLAPAAGIVGIQLLDAEGNVRRCCARTPTAGAMVLRTLFLDRLVPALVRPHFMLEWDHLDTRPVDQVMGAFLMIRRALFTRLGGFDERFFLYYEDVDLCLAARRAGWTVLHCAAARARHAQGGSTRAIPDARLCRLANSEVRFAAKYYGRASAIMLMLSILSFELPIRLLHAIVVRRDRRWVFRGAVMYWRSLPELLRQIVALT